MKYFINIVSSCWIFLGLTLYGYSQDSEQKPASQPPPAQTDLPKKAPPAQAPTKEPVTQQINPEQEAPSALSLHLANRLFLGTSLGFIYAKKGSDKLNAFGTTDISVGYMLDQLSQNTFKVLATLRYLPIEFDFEDEGSSYRGIAEGYFVGGLIYYSIKEKLFAVGNAEVGLVFINTDPLDSTSQQANIEGNGFNVNFGGGVDWQLIEKISLGPRLHLGSGLLTTVQLAAHLSCMF